MKLCVWIYKNKKTMTDFAKELNISKGHLSLLMNGKIIPRKNLMNKIYELTNKNVKPEDFYY